MKWPRPPRTRATKTRSSVWRRERSNTNARAPKKNAQGKSKAPRPGSSQFLSRCHKRFATAGRLRPALTASWPKAEGRGSRSVLHGGNLRRRSRRGLRLVPERRRSSSAAARVARDSGVSLPEVRDSGQALRQCPDSVVALAPRSLPRLRRIDLGSLPADRGGDGRPVRGRGAGPSLGERERAEPGADSAPGP